MKALIDFWLLLKKYHEVKKKKKYHEEMLSPLYLYLPNLIRETVPPKACRYYSLHLRRVEPLENAHMSIISVLPLI